MGHAVLMQADDIYQSIATEGLRTCVAFALINLNNSSVLLVHFYNLTQVRDSLKMMCDIFLEETTLNPHGMICVIAGGRYFSNDSMEMVDYLTRYVKEHLVTPVNCLKLRLIAPIVADYEETLSLKINLVSGHSEVSLNTTGAHYLGNSSQATTDEPDRVIDKELPFKPVTFTNAIATKRSEPPIYKPFG